MWGNNTHERFTSYPCHPFLTNLMSQTLLPPTSLASSNFSSILNTALNEYKKETKNDLEDHGLADQLENCTSPSAILAVLDQQCYVQQLIRSQNDNERLKRWLNATANVICAFSATISGTVGLVCRTQIGHLHP